MTHARRRIHPGLTRVRAVLDTLDRDIAGERLRRDVRWA